MKRLAVVTISTLLCAVTFGATTQVAFWRTYEANKWTYALFDFDKDAAPTGQLAKDARVALSGMAAIVEGGRFGKCLAVTGPDGVVTVDSPALFNPHGHHCTGIAVEAWVYLDKLPQTEACIIHRPGVGLVTKGFTLGVTPKGAVFLEVIPTRKHYNKPRRHASDDGALPVGRWVHVAATGHGHPVGKRRIFIDGRMVAELEMAWGLGIYVYDDEETKPGPVYIGNDEAGKRPFIGRIDQLRVQPNVHMVWPPVEQTFLDPEKKRPLPPAQKCFLPDLAVRAYFSFDDAGKADVLPEGVKAAFAHKSEPLPGVRGGASVDSVSLRGKALLPMTTGAVEAWFAPRDWDNYNGFHVAFFGANTHVGKLWPGFSFKVHNPGQVSRTGVRSTVLISRKTVPEGQSRYKSLGNFNIDWRPDLWHHVVVQWQGKRFQVYLDGALIGEDDTDELKDLVLDRFSVNAHQPAGFQAVDELYIYNRALTPDEVANAWRRYVDPDNLVPLRHNAIALRHMPGLHKMVVDVDHFAGPAAQVVKLSFVGPDGNEAAGQTVENVSYPAELVVDLPRELPAGRYTMRAQFIHDGRVVDNQMASREMRNVPWLHNRLGKGLLMKPWTPVKRSGNTVSVLLRDYDVSRGLVGSVKVRGDDILDGPITLRGTASGRPFVLDKPVSVKFEDASDRRVAWVQRFDAAGMTFVVKQRLEFDGYVDVALTMAAQDLGKPVTVESMTLEFPVKGEVGQSFHSSRTLGAWFACLVPEQAGSVWSPLDGFYSRSGVWLKPKTGGGQTVAERVQYGTEEADLAQKAEWMTVGSFVPYWWLGSDRGGISWCADNDRGWTIRDEVPSVELVKQPNGTSLVKVNLIGGETVIDKPRTLRFGWQATPVKTPGPGWRTIPEWRGFFPPHGRSCTYSPWPDADKWDYSVEQLRKFKKAGAGRRDFHLMPFTAYRATDDKHEWAEYFRYEWFPSRRGPWDAVGYSWDALMPESLVDYTVHMFKKWIEASSTIDGVYVDMIYVTPNTDTLRGTAYALPDGRIQPGYNVGNMRMVLKRYQGLLQQMGRQYPHVIAHMTHSNIPMVLSFADIAYEGECCYFSRGNFKRTEGQDSLSYWRPEILRATDDHAAMGYRYQWLHPIRDKHPDPARDVALRRAFEVIPLITDATAPRAMPGIDRARFVPFYRNELLTPAGAAPEIRTSLWLTETGWAAVVTNWSHEAKTVELILREALPKTEGEVYDIETNKPLATLKGKGARLKLTVGARDYRLVYLGEGALE